MVGGGRCCVVGVAKSVGPTDLTGSLKSSWETEGILGFMVPSHRSPAFGRKLSQRKGALLSGSSNPANLFPGTGDELGEPVRSRNRRARSPSPQAEGGRSPRSGSL